MGLNLSLAGSASSGLSDRLSQPRPDQRAAQAATVCASPEVQPQLQHA